MFTTFSVNAQFGSSGGFDFEGESRDWSISAITGLDVPLGDVATAYKASPFYNLQVLRNFGSLSVGVGGGLRWLKPKQAIFKSPPNDVYPIDLDVSYSDMNSKILYATAVYNYDINEQIVAFGGINIGYNNNIFATYGGVAGNPVFKVWTMENCLYLAPKLGAGYRFGMWQVNLESRFNYIKSNNSVEYKARVGAVPQTSNAYKTWATGLSLVLNF